jgi:hypothetical protein
MNTDNMSILGLTLDYGPYGFMEAYQPGFICNHSDHHGRYAFDKQPNIGLFNLSCLAQALLSLIEFDAAKAALDSYSSSFAAHYQHLMAQKLGFENTSPRVQTLLEALLEQMQQSRVDYTLSFRALSEVKSVDDQTLTPLRNQFVDHERFDHWLTEYRACLRTDAPNDAARGQAMNRVNPKYILRNYLAQNAIEKAARGDYTEVDCLLTLLQKPFDDDPAMSHYAAPQPEGADQVQVSCSS